MGGVKTIAAARDAFRPNDFIQQSGSKGQGNQAGLSSSVVIIGGILLLIAELGIQYYLERERLHKRCQHFNQI